MVAAATAEIWARKAGVARDMALNALENAMAVQDETEEELLSALKVGGKAKIKLARRSLEQATAESKQARKTAERIVEYAAESRSNADLAGEEASRASKAETDRKAASAARKAEHLAHAAKKSSKRTVFLADRMKMKWLIPLSTTTTTISPEPQPANATPAGQR